ncbi:MAG: hypothetical protein O3B87_03535 [bacterium]|nr:hypothetical protein [bacterium]
MSNPSDHIELSSVSKQLLDSLNAIKVRPDADDYTSIKVSQTVSFIALVYERVRNAIEYREDHLIRRAAIERNLKRRLSLNPEGKNEGENVIRELLWARYFPNGSMGESDVRDIQVIIDRYLLIKRKLLEGRTSKKRGYLSEFMFQLITAEIEEHLAPEPSTRESNFSYYIFQTLKDKVQIEDVKEDQKDVYLFTAIEKSFRKSDIAYLRYHLFCLFYQPLSTYTEPELDAIIPKLDDICQTIDEMHRNPTVDKLVRFVRKQLPPFFILFSLIRDNPDDRLALLSHKPMLWTKVEQVARKKYAEVRSRLNVLAFRSLIYIFVTKMLLALALEVPVSQFLYGYVHIPAIIINSVAPPIFMLLIILGVSVPGEANTKNLFLRIVHILDADSTFEKTKALITKKARQKRPLLSLGFTLLYTSTFIITLYLIHLGLRSIDFNILSEALFIFFISVVAFFAYRIKQLSNMYRLIEKTSILTPVIDFFFMPILSLGKLFSEGVSRLNFFIVIFDFIIEAPFKLIIEVIEEWISYVRQRKEEIV